MIAWLAEKSIALKLRVDDNACGPLRLLESLEAVALGIHGKSGMWRSLNTAAENFPPLQGLVTMNGWLDAQRNNAGAWR